MHAYTVAFLNRFRELAGTEHNERMRMAFEHADSLYPDVRQAICEYQYAIESQTIIPARHSSAREGLGWEVIGEISGLTEVATSVYEHDRELRRKDALNRLRRISQELLDIHERLK